MGDCTATTRLAALEPSAPLGRGSGASIVEMGLRRPLLGDGVGVGVVDDLSLNDCLNGRGREEGRLYKKGGEEEGVHAQGCQKRSRWVNVAEKAKNPTIGWANGEAHLSRGRNWGNDGMAWYGTTH